MSLPIRNIAIIAHVDHGKTTLVDRLLEQTHTLDSRAPSQERIMDNNDLERERGITILAKNTAITWNGFLINIVDTPGHADFSGEVERILSMVDGALLLVDAVDGPMPQTRFVTQKAFAQGIKVLVVVNKIDRVEKRPDAVINEIFDLFVSLHANESQLDFPVVYTSALQGYATTQLDEKTENMTPLLDAIIEHIPAPTVDIDAPLQMQICALDYSSYVGAIGIGRIRQGKLRTNQNVSVVNAEGKVRNARIGQILGYHGLQRRVCDEASAGEIVAITGIDNITISETICDPEFICPLPVLSVDEPTMSMTFLTNTSPFAGQDGSYLTARHLKARLQRECISNVALRVQETEDPNAFFVMGRGELHLGILIETMRREGYELAISRPEVIYKTIDNELYEPYEDLIVDVPTQYQGAIMQTIGRRKATLRNMLPLDQDHTRLHYDISSRSLFGLRGECLTLSSGTAILCHRFERYDKADTAPVNKRAQGVLIAKQSGIATAYALWGIQERGKMFLSPQTDVYEGMIVGLHSRPNDLVVNICREKHLTNIRAAGNDDNILLTPPISMTLEQAMEFIEDDELIEVTPKHIRLRKKYLKEHERKKSLR